MKKKYKLRRILITLVSICAVFSMFCVPVSATSTGWNTRPVSFTGEYRVRFADGTWEDYQGNYDDNGFLVFTILGGVTNVINNYTLAMRMSSDFFPVDSGDIVSIPYVPGGFGGWFGPDIWSITEYRWIVYDGSSSYSPGYIGEGPWVKTNLTGNKNWNITWSATTVTVHTPCEKATIGLQMRFVSTDYERPCTISVNNKTIDVGYGNPNSPEAPSYPKPDGSSFNDLHNKEDQILGGAQGGLDQASDLFGNTLSFLRSSSEAFLAVGALLTGLTGIGNNVIYGLLVFSLSLGLFAFIFNMGLSIAEKSSKDTSEPKHSRFRFDADGRKADGIATHRPSRK